ncbi:ATP-dependent Clp protease adapter ClpS [Georgenia faecalis]|uniref:ATP-dependent Clp protease adapter protein ClpS n=1 Tax=Georgenia faecalis TaxID=2483799 RepID=A0ABV9DFH8_9MICO|nr:ATP-dependent Clp protease adapter ClpS [Georgenia faecalis]
MSVSTGTPGPAPAPPPVEELGHAEAPERQRPWRTTVWNDPVNLMSYVTYVFRTYFGYSEAHAHRLMRHVHEDGRAVVSTGSREKMEVDVQAMHSYGLWATLSQGEDD